MSMFFIQNVFNGIQKVGRLKLDETRILTQFSRLSQQNFRPDNLSKSGYLAGQISYQKVRSAKTGFLSANKSYAKET
jgi:hypothetical protein